MPPIFLLATPDFQAFRHPYCQFGLLLFSKYKPKKALNTSFGNLVLVVLDVMKRAKLLFQGMGIKTSRNPGRSNFLGAKSWLQRKATVFLSWQIFRW